jgi:hypothetical protein
MTSLQILNLNNNKLLPTFCSCRSLPYNQLAASLPQQWGYMSMTLIV